MARTTTPPKPKKQRFARVRQMWAVFGMTRRVDKLLPWYMLLAAAVVWLVAFGIGVLVGHEIYVSVIGFPLGLLAALFVFARRAEGAAYAQNAGKPGVSLVALQGRLRRGWNIEQQPVAVSGDQRSPDLVFRAVGRPGVVLVTEGPLPRVQRTAEKEQKRISRILPNVPIHIVNFGDGEGQVPARKLGTKVARLKPTLTKTEVSEVTKRLRALGAAKPPIPKGVDPMRARPDRKATRGR